MSRLKKTTIGLFGFGVVGEGIYHVLEQTPGLNAVIKKVCIKHPDKKRNAPASLFTTEYDELLNDPEINVIIELINDDFEAYKIVTSSLQSGRAVVSANKKMIAEHLPELLELQSRNNVPFLYEAAVCGSIPVIRNLEEYYDNDLLTGICGIVNGSTNYILTKIFKEGLDFNKALEQAQKAGFAESDPSLDVSGRDAVNKLTILLLHGHGIVSHPGELTYRGIDQLHPYDATFAAEKRWQIKLTAQAKKQQDGKIAAFVLPQFITADSQLYTVSNEFNGIVLQSTFADKQFLYGKGAGRYPTASAVLSDISALRYNYRYEYRKLHIGAGKKLTTDFYLRVYISFNEWQQVTRDDFEWIEEFCGSAERNYLVGVIHFQKLQTATWLMKKGISLVVLPDGFVNMDTVKAKAQSIRLTGSRLGADVKNVSEEAALVLG